jgi:SAM-dependent methyltransferase
MPIACPVDLDTRMLRSEISSIYGRVAVEPTAEFHFHRGPAYAAEFLGYDARELASLPPECPASFAAISNPLAIGPIQSGETVVDIGCGAGMDLLLAARRVGPEGRAIGVDMTDTMIERAQSSAAAAGLKQVEVRNGDATAIPVSSGSVDVVISNGVLNLVPEKELGFAEIVRILKPGGRLYLGDIALDVESLGEYPPQHRLMDWLNRRRSAGGRARCVSEGDWPGRRAHYRPVRLFSRDIQGKDGTPVWREVRSRRRETSLASTTDRILLIIGRIRNGVSQCASGQTSHNPTSGQRLKTRKLPSTP